MLSRFRRQVRGLAGRIRQLSRGLSLCRQPSARAEIHSPPGPTGCSLDRAPLPASSFCHHFQHLECSYQPHTQFSEFTKRNPNAACDRETRNQSREHDGEPFVHDHSLAFFAPRPALRVLFVNQRATKPSHSKGLVHDDSISTLFQRESGKNLARPRY